MNTTNISAHRIPGHETFYVPDFVTEDEEEYLIRKISETPQQKWKQLTNRRLQLWGGEITSKNVLFAQALPPFLAVYPDIITRLKATDIFASSPHQAPNHVILNEYLPGQGIMPHEDGPTYYPVVATISLGSHSVLHYYRYNESVHTADSLCSHNGGRTIDSVPAMSVILERRSLVVSRGPMYTSRLHGIQDIVEDRVSGGDYTKSPIFTDLGVPVANWEMVTGEGIKEVMKEGGVLKRDVRYSLTFRDVEHVSSANSFLRR